MQKKFKKNYKSPKKSYSWVAFFLILGIFPYLLSTTFYHPYFLWILTLSLITFIFYGYDKIMAIHKGGRVPEIVLHGLSIFGGVIGGIIGMILFRHKKNSNVFFIVLFISGMLHLWLSYQVYPNWIEALLMN